MSPPYTPGGYGHALEQLLRAKGVAVQHAGGDETGGQAGDTRLGLLCTNQTGPGYLDFEGSFDLMYGALETRFTRPHAKRHRRTHDFSPSPRPQPL